MTVFSMPQFIILFCLHLLCFDISLSEYTVLVRCILLPKILYLTYHLLAISIENVSLISTIC